jgi:ABC-2 type transport system permease protein
MQANIPVPLFEIRHLAPGISVFGLSFLTLFSASLIARDRENAFLQRLYTTPMGASDFILGYMLPIVPIALAQGAVCYLIAFFLGLPMGVNVLYGALMLLPISVFYVSLGLLFGSILNVKQVGGICGALLTNLSAWLSGVWFDLELLGKPLGKFARFLPFVHAVELERAVIRGDHVQALSHLCPVLLYALLTTTVAILLLLRQMRKQ